MIKIEEQNLTEVQKIVKQKGFNLNAQNQSGQSALSQAVRKGNQKIIDILLNNGANLNIQNQAGQTPLFIACWYNKLDVAEFLLNKGADVNCQDHRKWSPLTIAAYQGNVQLLEILSKYNPNYYFQQQFVTQSGKSVMERAKDEQIKKLIAEKINEKEQYQSKQQNSYSPLNAIQTAKFPFQASQYLTIHETPLIKRTNKNRNNASKSPYNESQNIQNYGMQEIQNEFSLGSPQQPQQFNFQSPLNEASNINYYFKTNNQIIKQQELSGDCNLEEQIKQLKIEPSQLDTVNQVQQEKQYQKNDNPINQNQLSQVVNNFIKLINTYFENINSEFEYQLIEQEEVCKQIINLMFQQQNSFLSKFLLLMNNEFFPKLIQNISDSQSTQALGFINQFQEEFTAKIKLLSNAEQKNQQKKETLVQQNHYSYNLDVNQLFSNIMIDQDQKLNFNLTELQKVLTVQKEKFCQSIKQQVSSELQIVMKNINQFVQNQNDVQLPNIFKPQLNIESFSNKQEKISRSKTPQVQNQRPILSLNQGAFSPNSQLINLDSLKKSPLRLSRDYQSYSKSKGTIYSRQNKTAVHFEFNENNITEIKTPEKCNNNDFSEIESQNIIGDVTPRQDSSSKLQQLRQSIQKKLSNIEMNYVNTYQKTYL